jgi:hypothetical protein
MEPSFDMMGGWEIETVDWDTLQDILDLDANSFCASTSFEQSTAELSQALADSKEEARQLCDLPGPSEKRFKSVSETDINDLKDKRQSEATKRNTKWGLKLFQGMFTQILLIIFEI